MYATQLINLLIAASLCGFLLKQMLCWAFHTLKGAKIKWQGLSSLTREGYRRLFMTSQRFRREFLKEKKKSGARQKGLSFWELQIFQVHLAKTLKSANVRLKCCLCLSFVLFFSPESPSSFQALYLGCFPGGHVKQHKDNCCERETC